MKYVYKVEVFCSHKSATVYLNYFSSYTAAFDCIRFLLREKSLKSMRVRPKRSISFEIFRDSYQFMLTVFPIGDLMCTYTEGYIGNLLPDHIELK